MSTTRPIVLVIEGIPGLLDAMKANSSACEIRRGSLSGRGVLGLESDDRLAGLLVGAREAGAAEFAAIDALRRFHPDCATMLVVEEAGRDALNEACLRRATVVVAPLEPPVIRAFLDRALAPRMDFETLLTSALSTMQPSLSLRERQIAADTARGLSQKEISEIRGLELTTVKTYAKRIRAKTGAGRLEDFARPLLRALLPDKPRR